MSQEDNDEYDDILGDLEEVGVPETGIIAAQKVRKQLDIDWSDPNIEL